MKCERRGSVGGDTGYVYSVADDDPAQVRGGGGGREKGRKFGSMAGEQGSQVRTCAQVECEV